MTLADRLNQIISEQGITKAEFAHRLGVTENYIYILTGSSRPNAKETRTISTTLAKLIALEFGYDAQWILNGNDERRNSTSFNMSKDTDYTIQEKYHKTLKRGKKEGRREPNDFLCPFA